MRDIDGQPVGERIQAARRDAVPAPYYDFRPTIETPGFYFLVVDGGPPEGATFDVAEPGSVTVPSPSAIRCRRSTLPPPTMPAVWIRSARSSPNTVPSTTSR